MSNFDVSPIVFEPKCEICELRGVVSYQHKLESLYQLAIEVVALRDLQLVLDTSLSHCLALTQSQFGFIGLTTEDDSALDLVAIQGFEAEPEFYDRFHLIPLRRNLFGNTILENRPVRSQDALNDPARMGQPSGHPTVRAFLGVPLRVREQTIGMIGAANKDTEYTDEDEQLLVTYASLVAIAIHNANLYEQLSASRQELERKVSNRTKELAIAKDDLAQKAEQLHKLLGATVIIQEAERARIAHDMHDGMTQMIVSTLFETQCAKESLALANKGTAMDHLEDVQTLLKQIDTEIRRIIYDLRPLILDARGLVPAIEQFTSRCQQYSKIKCSLNVSGDPYRLRSDVEIGIYRLIQEALQNITTHAKATQADIQLEFTKERVIVSIRDNGIGFNFEHFLNEPGEHLGLIGMKERTQCIGGQIDIQTKPDHGTRIILIVPSEQLA
jgi:signal transduction histidine kinase